MNMLRIAALVTFCLFAPTLPSGCASIMMRSAISNARAPNYFFLHKDPKVGDFAVYAYRNSNRRHRVEIVSFDQRNGLYEICSGSIRSTLRPGTVSRQLRLFVDRTGRTRRAFLTRTCREKGGVRIRVAKKGEIGHIESPRRVRQRLVINEKVKTGAGTFLIREFVVYRSRLEIFRNVVVLTNTALVHPDAHFLVVTSRSVVSERDAPFLTVLEGVERIVKLGSAAMVRPDATVRLVLALVRSTARGEKGAQNMQLVHQN